MAATGLHRRTLLVREQLARVLASAGFVNSNRMRDFLQLVVDNALSGETPLKETLIGIAVFRRAPSYDPAADPIVRVEARRLRRKLGEYYDGQGTTDAVLIAVPKGGYMPRFEFRPAAGPAAIASIAVLPMANLSGDPALDYLADAMTDELIRRLAGIRSLRVISRTSAMRYKGARKTLPAIARELGVDAVVEGSVRRTGDQVRIAAQLIDAAADRHLWWDDYRRPIADGLTVQCEVARRIASQVRRTVSRRCEGFVGGSGPQAKGRGDS